METEPAAITLLENVPGGRGDDREDPDRPRLTFVLEREIFLRKILNDAATRILDHDVHLHDARIGSQRGQSLRSGGVEE
jgi:hypothetical protein